MQLMTLSLSLVSLHLSEPVRVFALDWLLVASPILFDCTGSTLLPGLKAD